MVCGGSGGHSLGMRTVWLLKIRPDLLLKGYSQSEGVNYDETFVPLAGLEAIKLFSAYESHKKFKVYQIDVKSEFSNDVLNEEIYTCIGHKYHILGKYFNGLFKRIHARHRFSILGFHGDAWLDFSYSNSRDVVF